MTRASRTFTSAEVARAVKAVTDAGLTVQRVIIDGKRIELETHPAFQPPQDPFDLVDMRK